MAARVMTLGRASGAAAAVAVVAAVGPMLGEYDAGLMATAFIYAISAVSLDLVWGYAGAPDLGHALWFGIGALTVGFLTTTRDHTGLVVSVHAGPGRYAAGIVAGMVLAALVAGVVGRFSFSAKASPFYIAIVTLALATVATTLYSQFPRWTGGDNGLFGFGAADVSSLAWYYIALGILALVTLGAVVLVRSDLGLVLRAVRDNEHRARYLGYHVERIKTVTFMGGAALAALAGGLYAIVAGVVSADLFSFLFATEMLVWVAVGGRGTIIGPIIGAVALQLLGSRLSTHFPTQWSLIEGLLFVLVVVFVPDGVVVPVARLAARLTRWGRGRGDREIVLDPARPAPHPLTSPVIECRDVHFGYGSLRVLRGLDLDVGRGQLLCIVGPNGAGKSSLLSVISDGRLPVRGRIRFRFGRDEQPRRPPHRMARAGVSRKFQAPQLFPTLTVAETMMLAKRAGRLPNPWRRSREVPMHPAVLDVIDATGLAGRDNDPATVLAHGLKQGLEIAAAVSSRPQVLLLDEPTAGLTSVERHTIGTVLRRLVDNGMTVVLIEHDLDFVNDIADRIVVLHDGRIIEDGTPDEIRNSATVREAYLGSAVST